MAKEEKYEYTYDAVGKEEKKSYGYGYRHIQVMLMFLALTTLYTIRTAMSIAILAMVDKTLNSTDIQVFDWDKQTQDVVLSSFYWGYALLQIPGAVLAYHFGAWLLISLSLLVNCIVSFTIPSLARWGGWLPICICRMLMGVAQGFILPSLHTLLAKWVPVSERSTLSYLVFCGVYVGTILSQPLAGFIASSRLGWPGIFYLSGGMVLVIGSLWAAFGSNGPEKHKRISIEERNFIENSLNSTSKNTRPKSMPWRDIFTSRKVWAALISHFFWNWVFVPTLVETPSYIKNVLGINIQDSGILSGLPYVATWVLGLVASIVSDYIVNKNIVSVITARKIFNSVGIWIPSAFLVLLSYLPKENTTLSIIVIIMIIGFTGCTNSGFILVYMDMSTNFAGILLALGNGIGNFISVLAPISVGYILNEHETEIGSWRVVFLSTAAIAFISNLIFVIFVTSDEQPWNRVHSEEKETELTGMETETDKKKKEANL